MDKEIEEQLLTAQKNEITEYHVYRRLARTLKDSQNGKALERIADEEFDHYNFWKERTKKEVRPNRWQIFKFFFISRILGVTFGIKLMERGEQQAQIDYERERIVRVDLPCQPCQQRICPQPAGPAYQRCMAEITVDMVLSAAEELLAEKMPAAEAPR